MGTLYNYPHLNVDRPCTGDCILLGISAGLEVCFESHKIGEADIRFLVS
jgi:hypothetical protein